MEAVGTRGGSIGSVYRPWGKLYEAVRAQEFLQRLGQ